MAILTVLTINAVGKYKMSKAPNTGKSRRLAPTLMSCSLVIVLCLGAITPASAKDLNVPIRIAYAAFLAEQGSSMCNLPRLSLPTEDRVVFVDAKNYANWIKQQISTGLSDQDVQYVLTAAATSWQPRHCSLGTITIVLLPQRGLVQCPLCAD